MEKLDIMNVECLRNISDNKSIFHNCLGIYELALKQGKKDEIAFKMAADMAYILNNRNTRK